MPVVAYFDLFIGFSREKNRLRILSEILNLHQILFRCFYKSDALF